MKREGMRDRRSSIITVLWVQQPQSSAFYSSTTSKKLRQQHTRQTRWGRAENRYNCVYFVPWKIRSGVIECGWTRSHYGRSVGVHVVGEMHTEALLKSGLTAAWTRHPWLLHSHGNSQGFQEGYSRCSHSSTKPLPELQNYLCSEP